MGMGKERNGSADGPMGMTPGNTVVLACDALAEHIAAAQASQKTAFPVVLLDRGLHLEPSNMQNAALAAIDSLPKDVETVLVCMGFCGGAWDHVTAPRRLIIPRVDDCVSMLLHTDDAYQPNRKAPWHMYMYENDPATFSLEKMMRDVDNGSEYAGFSQEQLFHLFFDGYRNVDIVDTGLNDCYAESYVEKAQEFADGLSAELDFVQGGVYLLEKLVSGRWDEQFLVAEPGDLIRHGSFFE